MYPTMRFSDAHDALQALLGEHVRIDELVLLTRASTCEVRFTMWGHPDMTEDTPEAEIIAARKRVEASPDWILEDGFRYTVDHQVITRERRDWRGNLTDPPVLRFYITGTMTVKPAPVPPPDQTARP